MSKYDFMKEDYAFPASGDSTILGMQLRDYFAAKAMAALIAMHPPTPFEEDAQRAYAIADAMMDERERTKANES